jgi:cohesin complex subunit SA-1/2
MCTCTHLFYSVFVPRFRDKYPIVREASITALGNWTTRFPPFVQVNHLKYLGWSLNDSDAGVRKSAVQSLTVIFQKWSSEEPLILFHKRFSPRILDMLNDVDSSIVTLVIELITLILQ